MIVGRYEAGAVALSVIVWTVFDLGQHDRKVLRLALDRLVHQHRPARSEAGEQTQRWKATGYLHANHRNGDILNDLAKAVKRVKSTRSSATGNHFRKRKCSRRFPLLIAATLLSPSLARAEESAPTELEAGETALETYELNSLQLIHIGTPDEEGSWRPARGKYRRAMSYEEFYRAVGRPELADEHAQRTTLSKILFYAGWGTMLAGGVLFFVGFEEGEPQTVSWIGAGVAAGGVGLVFFGGSLDGVKMNERDAEALSAEHNVGLQRRLGLASERSSLRRSLPRFRLSLVPRLEKTSGFVGLLGEFSSGMHEQARAEQQRRRRRLQWLLWPLGTWFVAFSTAIAFAPMLLERSPETLLLLAPLSRHLVLLSPSLDSATYFVLGAIGCSFPDPFSYVLGREYGQAAISWMERRSGGAHWMRLVERAFRRAAPVVLFVAPGPLMNLLAGATGMRVPLWLAINLAGTATVLVLMRLSGEAFADSIFAIREFIETNVVALTVVSVGLVVAGALIRSRRARQRAVSSELRPTTHFGGGRR